MAEDGSQRIVPESTDVDSLTKSVDISGSSMFFHTFHGQDPGDVVTLEFTDSQQAKVDETRNVSHLA
jgi:hypothetical protein